MFRIACEKCRKESHDWFKADRLAYPDSPERERFGRRMVFLATQPVDNCPDCRLL